MIYLGSIPMKDLLFKMWNVLICFHFIKRDILLSNHRGGRTDESPGITFLQKKHSGYFSWEWVLDKMFANNQDTLM